MSRFRRRERSRRDVVDKALLCSRMLERYLVVVLLMLPTLGFSLFQAFLSPNLGAIGLVVLSVALWIQSLRGLRQLIRFKKAPAETQCSEQIPDPLMLGAFFKFFAPSHFE